MSAETHSPENARTLTSVAELTTCPVLSVLIDRFGVAWQVIQLGADWSCHKTEKDTRRPGFVQAGNHVHYEAAALATVLPVRLIDDGHPEPDGCTEDCPKDCMADHRGERCDD